MLSNLKTPCRAALVLLLTALIGGCGWFGSDSASNTADLAAIEDFNRRYLAAINSADVDTLSALTTESHIMLPPDGAPIAGKAASVAAWRGQFERFEIEESWLPGETALGGDWAWQRGRFQVAATPRTGGTALISSGHYLRIFARQPDGTWRMTIDMFSGDTSAQQ